MRDANKLAGLIGSFLFSLFPAVFPSDYPLDVSVERLHAAMPVLFSEQFGGSTLVGTVSKEEVRLTRERMIGGSASQPQFVGRFQEEGGRVVLAGHFTVKNWRRVHVGCALSFMLVWTTLTTVSVLANGLARWWAPLFGVGFMALIVGDLKLNEWFSRNDVAWLSGNITRALTTPDKLTAEELKKIPWPLAKFLDYAGQ